jgi:hypothetical protein
MVERTSYKLTAIVALAMAAYAAGARADDADTSIFSFSGFGTLGAVHSSEKKADFTNTFFKPNGAGFTHAWSVDVDSLLAGQVSADFTPQLSAVLQVVSEQNYDNSYRPHVEWANLKYQFAPEFDVRVGRTALPTFIFADSRRVGYAFPWVRPPVEVYRLVPVTSNDGVDASYRVVVGAATNTFQANVGRSDTKFPDSGAFGSGTGKARKQLTVVDTFEQGFLTLRASYGETRLTIAELGPLFDAFRQFGPEGIAIADRYDLNDRLVNSLGIGASYDPGSWFVMGEWGRINTRSVLGEHTGWYVSGGYRFEKLTPYLSYARTVANTNTSDPGLTVSALPPSLAGPAGSLNAALNTLLGASAVQHTVSVGGRWDFLKNAAFKLQLDHTQHGANSAGTLSNVQPGFQPGGKVDVISMTIDFVF